MFSSGYIQFPPPFGICFLSCISHTWIYTRKLFAHTFLPPFSHPTIVAQPSPAPLRHRPPNTRATYIIHLVPCTLPCCPPHRILLFSCLSSSSREGLMTTTREYDGDSPRSVGVVENLPMPMRGFHDGGDGVEICGGGDQLERFRG